MISNTKYVKRRRAFKKAKLTNTTVHWNKFRRLENQVVSSIKLAKDQYIDSLSNKLKHSVLSSNDWWKYYEVLILIKSLLESPLM
jgi:hypothetical protein